MYYGYFPSKGVAITFVALYGLSTLCHIAQATYYRIYWLFATVILCGAMETTGWTGRLWSSISPFLKTPFQIQITSTILAPTPLLAANFVIFGIIVNQLGPQYSRLKANRYTAIFCACDVLSLVIQGLGGAIAAAASTLHGANQGANIMLGGIVFQLFVIILFSLCVLEYLIRHAKDAPVRSESTTRARGVITRKLEVMLGGLAFVTLLLFIRSVYRTVELADGWTGRIIRTEVYFNVLDGGMVTLAMYTYNFCHPGWFLTTFEKERYRAEEKGPSDA